MLSSVHAFGESSLGYFFLAFLVTSLLLSLYLLHSRRGQLKAHRTVESLLSRESGFLFNNLILVSAAFSIFWGTIFPLVSEAVRGVKIVVGPPFFNRVSVPLGLALMLLIGICPLLAWRRLAPHNLRRNFLAPAVVALASAVVMVASGVTHPWALSAFTLSVFVLTIIGFEFWKGVRARRSSGGRSPFRALASLLPSYPRRYGGFLVHAAVVVMIIGIAGSSAYHVEKEVNLGRGESTQLKRYTFTFEGLSVYKTPQEEMHVAELSLSNKGRKVAMLRPEQHIHLRGKRQTTSEVAVKTSLREDIYTILGDYSSNGERATFRLMINPLVIWIWIGGGILTLGWFFVFFFGKQFGSKLESCSRRNPHARTVSLLSLAAAAAVVVVIFGSGCWALAVGGAILGLATLLSVGYPHFSHQSADWLISAREHELSEGKVRELQARQNGLTAEVQELEFDYRAGRLPEPDYRERIAQLRAEAEAVREELERLQRVEKVEEFIESEVFVARRRSGEVPSPSMEGSCPQCGAPNAPRDRFCSNCGSRLRED